MLSDRAKRIRWRAAWQLLAWAADVPVEVVEIACNAEKNADVRRHLEALLQTAKAEQAKARSA